MKLKIKTRVVIGIAGIIFFLGLNIFSFINIDTNSNEYSYNIFLKLFKNLSYNITNFYNVLPENRNSVLIIFDFTKNHLQILPELLKWVEKGGVLFIAGIDLDYCPVTKLEIKKSYSGFIIPQNRYGYNVNKLYLQVTNYLEFPSEQKDILFQNYYKILNQQNKVFFYEKDIKKGKVIVLVDSYLISDIYMSNIKNAGFAILLNNIFKNYFNKKILIYKIDSLRKKHSLLLPLLYKKNAKIVIAQFLIIYIAFLLYIGIKFDNSIDPEKYKKKSIVYHLKAIAMFYRKSKKQYVVKEINNEYFKYFKKK